MPKLAILCSGSGAMPKIRQGANKDLRLADIMVSGGPLNSRAALDGLSGRSCGDTYEYLTTVSPKRCYEASPR